MSIILQAYTPIVPNYLQLLEQNLRLPLEKGNRYTPLHYNPGFELDYTLCDVLEDYSCISYYHYFEKNSALRKQYFDVVRAMGGKEIWIMDDFATENLDDNFKSIYEFLDYLSKHAQFTYADNSEIIKEFDINVLEYDAKGYCTNYYSVYHDTFVDCFAKVNEIEKKYNVHVLGLNQFGGDSIRVIQNNVTNEIKLLNIETGEFKDSEF